VLYTSLYFPWPFSLFAIPTLGPELYEEMNLDESDAKLIPRVLNGGTTFNFLTRSSLMQYDKA